MTKLNQCLLIACGVLCAVVGLLLWVNARGTALPGGRVPAAALHATPEPTIEPTPTATPTPVPTLEPTPLPTATPTPTPLVFEYSFNAHPVLARGTESGALFLENGAGSSGSLEIELVLEETEEKLYCSARLAPGETERYATLLLPLEKGSYPVIVKLRLIEPETGETLDERESAMTITVQK